MTKRRGATFGLTGFILAGFVFIAGRLKDGHWMLTFGSLIWTLSCLIWLVSNLDGSQA